jgi:hypothetical protein
MARMIWRIELSRPPGVSISRMTMFDAALGRPVEIAGDVVHHGRGDGALEFQHHCRALIAGSHHAPSAQQSHCRQY